jgi:hypothetical protein
MHLLSRLPPVPCRTDLAEVAKDYFYSKGNAVEIGVNTGMFAENNLKTWNGSYACVDAWDMKRMGDMNTQEQRVYSTSKGFENLKLTKDRTKFAEDRVMIIQNFSTNAASKFPDEYFDWIYIDAQHTYKACYEDMEAWWPKLRHGGLFSGDDYADIVDTKYLKVSRNKKYMDNIALMKRLQRVSKNDGAKISELMDKKAKAEKSDRRFNFDWGVILATQNFVEKKGGSLHVTYMRDCYRWPAWYLVKPPKELLRD